uniref:Glutaredoxin domain-containing protein n=1 Tax=Neobodo designis TaxID=312471 RepID=A0A7S1LYG7_NEODS|mmetsp:Transcript_30654/g.94702  ORF Transcript_30654/g.94702 Transcript_30654/m.94702 type:complete len:503 (+) Transcript_30654:78-1586(+)
MGCCNSAEQDAAPSGERDDFNDLQEDRKGQGMGAQRPRNRKSDRYAASSADGDDDVIDMDALNDAPPPQKAKSSTSLAAGASSASTAAPAPGADAAANDASASTSSTASSSSSEQQPAVIPPPKPVVRVPAARGAGGESLAMTAAEEEAHRARVEAVHRELGAPKTMDVVFDDAPEDDLDLADMMDRAAGAVVEDVGDFEAGLAVASPTKDQGFENPRKEAATREPPLPQWFEDRGVSPPKSVVWFQSSAEVTIEIAPANDDVGYALEDGDKLLYNCQDPCESDLLAMSSGQQEQQQPLSQQDPGDIGDDDIVVYTTSMTNDRMVRDRCRLMENQLYLHELKYVTVDVAENAFIRKKLVELAGGTDHGLPLLFVGDRFVCTYDAMQDLVDDDKLLGAIGPAAVAKAANAPRPEASSGVVNPVQHRVDLYLLHPLRGAKFTVERSTRPGAASDEKMLVLRASKERRGQYWSQLIHGSLAEVSSIEWLRKDLEREADSDEDDDE